jgi:hypothetical protein
MNDCVNSLSGDTTTVSRRWSSRRTIRLQQYILEEVFRWWEERKPVTDLSTVTRSGSPHQYIVVVKILEILHHQHRDTIHNQCGEFVL